jgi:MoxR-like ATPase
MTPEEAGQLCQNVKTELSKAIIGQDKTVDELIISLFSKGHCLLIGVPGLAKTLLVKSLAQVIDVDFNRIQFTPDLMPADIIGSELVSDQGGKLSFEYQQGPVFTNLLLADEINRTPPKTQAALLEAMQERKVTSGGQSRDLPKPFLVVATQNPIEQEGTYPLPEAQLDRFMFSLNVAYPTIEEERTIVKQTTGDHKVELSAVITLDQIIEIQDMIRELPVSDHVINYAVDLVSSTRPGTPKAVKATNDYIDWGAGPRASQYLILGAKAISLLNGRLSPEVKDVKEVAAAVLQHRIVINYKATGQGLDAVSVTQKVIDQLVEEKYS